MGLGAALAWLATGIAIAAPSQPPAPYYSIELGRAATREQALTWLRQFDGPEPARAEVRRSGYYLRAGAWSARADAEAARQALGGRLATAARVLQIQNPAPWLVASGETVPAPPGTTSAGLPTPAPPPAPAAPAASASASASADPPAAEDLTALDLDQLLSMEITGVTRRAGSYGRAPAAIFVLTGEDIRRAGVRTLADALRLVPGLQVTRTNAQSYTVTARGFGGDKLQVLLDDRSVYTPLTSTVFWDVFDTYLDDIARIEVIRGPGASVYGANAVNGVINIVTRPAGDSGATHLHAGSGTEERAFGGFRSGGRIGDRGHGRAYAKGRERDSTERADGSEAQDGQSQVQAGGRIDAELGGLGALTLQGDVYRARQYSSTFPPSPDAVDTVATGRNFGSRWTYGWAGGAQTQASAYYDGYDRTIPTIFDESRDTYDLNVQHNLADRGAHRVTLGAGARLSRDQTGGPPLVLVFEPANATRRTYSTFAQDEISLGDFSLVVGAKLEHNDFSGTEFQPSLRAGWAATDRLFTWASVARATRTPNRLDHDTGLVCTGVDTPVVGCPGGGTVLAIGSKDFDSEKLVAYEWGLRAQPARSLVTDLALFYNDYDDLRSTEAVLRFGNLIEAQSYGGELAATWEPVEWVTLRAFYAYVDIDARTDEASTDANTVYTLEHGTGNQSVGVRLALQPFEAVTADAFLRHVDNLGTRSVAGPAGVDAYTELNLRLGWTLTPFVELGLVGENLLDHAHPEVATASTTRSEIPRSIFAGLTWRWQ